MKECVSEALGNAMDKIGKGFPVLREADFHAVLFGELYKKLPDAVVRFETTMGDDYQSYKAIGSLPKNRKSRVDIHIEHNNAVSVVELKYFKGAGQAVEADMLADIAKLERIVEAHEASEGFCIQLLKPGVMERLPSGCIENGRHTPSIAGWDYDFEIKGKYEISPLVCAGGYTVIVHHIGKSS